MIRGSCLCGGVRYEITGPFSDLRNCHCTMCRKAHSAAFRSRGSVSGEDFRFVSGEDLLTFYETSPENHRGFCRVCGSAVYTKSLNNPARVSLPLGLLDDDPGVSPQLHIWVENKAPWFTITDDLPQKQKGPDS